MSSVSDWLEKMYSASDWLEKKTNKNQNLFGCDPTFAQNIYLDGIMLFAKKIRREKVGKIYI